MRCYITYCIINLTCISKNCLSRTVKYNCLKYNYIILFTFINYNIVMIIDNNISIYEK